MSNVELEVRPHFDGRPGVLSLFHDLFSASSEPPRFSAVEKDELRSIIAAALPPGLLTFIRREMRN